LADKKKHSGKQDEPSQEDQNFQRLLEGALAVSKDELDKRRDKYEREQEKRQKR
jgi:hypothetical protein